MGVFPENPCEFAVEFIRKMRSHKDIIQIPSSRQVLSIPKMILSRYYRKGSLTPNDYIDICAVTSYPDNQELAKNIAFELLFPNFKKDIMDDFFNDEQILDEENIESEIKSEIEQLQELVDEIENKNTDSSMIQKLEDFMEVLDQKRNEEPFKSALNFFSDDSDLYKQEITTLQELMEEAKNRMIQKINSLDPNDLKAGQSLDLNDQIQEKSLREWEKITSKTLNGQDIAGDLKKLLNSENIEDIIQTLKYLNDSEAISKDKLQKMKNNLENQIKNLDQLFNAAKNLRGTPKFDQEKVLENSLEQSSFDHNFNMANSMDQNFGTDLRASLLDKYSEKSQKTQINLSLDSITKNAMARKSWNSLFKQALQKTLKDAYNQPKKNEAMMALSNQLKQLANSCQNIHSGQKMAQELPEIMKKTIESCEDSEQLRNTLEFLRNIGLQPDSGDIRQKGNDLKMPEEDIMELIEPDYQLLKKLTEKNEANFQRLSNLMNQIKDQLNPDRIKELMSTALNHDNREALGALGHFDLGEAVKSAQQTSGEKGEDMLISSLIAGNGENLLKQWYKHRNKLSSSAKPKIKELAKALLIELAIYYSRARLGSATTGPIPINIVRPYTVGDDFENVDLEETIFHILEKGKKLEHINYDDFLVNETAKGLRSACIELDISGSMEGNKLAQLALCATMLVYGLRKDELAITFFESNTHILKNIDEDVDLEKLADDLLSIRAEGGTRIQKAIEWAREQFNHHSNSREKLNILFTDGEIFDLKDAIEELRIMRSMGVDFILVCPETQYNIKEAEKMTKIAGGQLLTLSDWNEFPKLIADIIKSKF